MSKITVALISPLCLIGDSEANLAHFRGWIDRAVAAGARFLAFPEMALSGYARDPAVLEAAQPIPGPLTEELAEITAKHDIYLSMGMVEQRSESYYNAQVFLGPDGYIGHYCKHYPTPLEREILGILPGDSYPTFMLDGIKLGINICADSRHRDTIDALAEQGVQLIHTPHSNGVNFGNSGEVWTRSKLCYYLERIWRCRAHILINNMAGSVAGSDGATFSYSSGCLILDPLGQVVERTTQPDNHEKMIIATLDTDIRTYIPGFEACWPYLKSISRIRDEMPEESRRKPPIAVVDGSDGSE